MTDYHYGRKRNGIRHELKQKLNEWIATISDKALQQSIKKDVIVTGGAIASMLLGEKVNDFDLYFKTRETTIDVANYYVDLFNKTNKLTSINNYKPYVKAYNDRVKIHMQSAGVAAEGQSHYSYSEWTPDTALKFAITLIKQNKTGKEKYRPICMTDNAITLSEDIQLITRFFGEPNEIHENYDFAHAMCYWDHGNNELVLPPLALEALLARNLIYKGSLYPVASIFRMKKFLQRGWRINAGNQLKIMLQISELDLKNVSVLQEQLIGVDVAYMYELLSLIREVDPQKIDHAYLCNIIDNVFDADNEQPIEEHD